MTILLLSMMTSVLMHTKKNINTKMEANNSLENQVKTLQRQFGGMAKLVKDLKSTVESLERKVSP